MRGIAAGAWGVLNRRFQPWPWLELVGNLAMAALALSWLLVATLASQLQSGILWIGFFAYLVWLTRILRMTGYGRQGGKIGANPAKRVTISKLNIIVSRPFSSTSTAFSFLGVVALLFAFFFFALRLTLAESTIAWFFALLYLLCLVFRPGGHHGPPRSGPPPTSPPKPSPSGTPVLPVFPDDVLVAKDEKEFPLERTG